MRLGAEPNSIICSGGSHGAGVNITGRGRLHYGRNRKKGRKKMYSYKEMRRKRQKKK